MDYHCVYESGFCGYSVHRKLKELGIKCSLVHPLDIPQTNKEKLNKSDKIDCRKLAKHFEFGSLCLLYIPDERTETVRMFSHRRLGLAKDFARLKNQIKASLYYKGLTDYLDENTRYWSKAFINYLLELKDPEIMKSLMKSYLNKRNEIAELIKECKLYIKDNQLLPLFRLLESVPGVGFKTALILASEVEDINRFNNVNQFSSYVGFIPMLQSSGEKQWGNKLHKRHNKHLRIALIESAWTAVRFDQALREYYLKQCKTKTSTRSIVKVAKKLVNRIYHIWKTGELYEINHYN